MSGDFIMVLYLLRSSSYSPAGHLLKQRCYFSTLNPGFLPVIQNPPHLASSASGNNTATGLMFMHGAVHAEIPHPNKSLKG
ncbi:MAG: hypothetical protein DCC43_13905 [Candidatus Brocadia sp.]|nr:hypothetical protein [Candidatus Brocadia sp.]MCE7911751.1 hypothetical protein [Candidatus Brocadia sp. AMX3]MDG5995730.1 hypothetical protein [Candidatus Brocadia sp.]RIJ92029.1 MAG: hypothetical protein DCC43_13905 [Candidatus Brocadia sp.]UJS19871.1 MAG: hypothetical protein L3J18_13325 [Candidatus Brocadia sp.]